VIAGDEININPTNGRPGGVINLIAANTYYSGNLVQGSSDLSLKTDIATIPNALEKVCALRGVNFRWKDNILDHSLHIGVVGQEVEKVFPEVVSTHEGKKYVAYEALVGPLIEAVKAQQKEIDALRAEVAALKR